MALLLGMALAACASPGVGTSGDPYGFSSTDRPPRIRLVIRNMNFNDVRLFALTPSGRTSIGHVGGKQDAEFVLDWPISAYMSIEIDMVAGPKCTTQEMQVDPGDILELQVAVVFDQTSGCR
ncbi:MAG: hypothetical protein ACPHQP_03005 [Longimicrobiales bacterium]